MTPNPIILEIKTLSPDGLGVAQWEGKTVLVRDALAGEQVEAEIIRRRRGQTEAKTLRVIVPAQDRVSPRCAHFGICGGCKLQHLSYDSQVEWKGRWLGNLFRAELPGQIDVPLERVAMEDPWQYRGKMEFSFSPEEGRLGLGLHRSGSFQRVVNLKECPIAPDVVSALLPVIRAAAEASGQPAYDTRRCEGFWRHAVVRVSRSAQTAMVTIVTREGPAEWMEPMVRMIREQVPQVKALFWGISNRISDVAYAEKMTQLFGDDHLEDQIGAVRFHFGPTQFVQPNRLLAEAAYQAIRENCRLTGNETVYDLYCGMGLISLALAPFARAVYGVESESDNVALAEQNAALNGITNASFICGKTEDLLRGGAIFKLGGKPDRIVLDPPRAGLHGDSIAPVLQARAPRIVYLSCNPKTLVNDLKAMLKRDPAYRVERVQWFDFFPHTIHMETLVTLVRR